MGFGLLGPELGVLGFEFRVLRLRFGFQGFRVSRLGLGFHESLELRVQDSRLITESH